MENCHMLFSHMLEMQPVLTSEVSRLSCISGSMSALDCSFLVHDHGSNKSSPLICNQHLAVCIVALCCNTVVLTSCMDTFYCFSLFLLSDVLQSQ